MPLDWVNLRVRINFTGRVRCEPGWRLDMDWSRRLRDLDLWYVWAGVGRMTMRGGAQLALRPGTCLWMRPGGTYLAQQDDEHRLGVTFIHFDLLDQADRAIPPPADLPDEVHEIDDVVYGDAVLRRVAELHRLGTFHGAAAAHLLTGFLMELDGGSSTLSSATDPGAMSAHHCRIALAAAARIRESPAQAPDVATLAAEAGYSVDHFARVFRAVLGRSPRDFLVQARIDRARQLLRESSLSVTRIADALGYHDVYFFSRQFKQRTGRSPTQYRRGPTTPRRA